MSDISKCDGKDCPLKESCYRYLAPEGRWQSWIAPPVKDGECELYWEVKSKSQLRRLDIQTRENDK